MIIPTHCPICGKFLLTKKLLNLSFPSYEGHNDCVKIIKKHERERLEEARKAERALEIEQLIHDGFEGQINWKQRSWEQWVENSENKGVTELLKGLVHDSKGLLLSGTPGIGKTHLLAATAIQFAKEYERPFKFIRFGNWADEIRAVPPERTEMMTKELQQIPFLFLDDIGTSVISDHIEGKLCRILDYRLEFKLPTFISTNVSGDEINKIFSPRIMSRLIGLCEWIDLSDKYEDWRAK